MLHLGTSGWQYDDWRGAFYPEDLATSRWFEHYAKAFDSVEVNNTFYHLPDRETFVRWHEQAPPGFRYALKFSRYGSHMKKLRDPESLLGPFLERAETLKNYLGPVLVQLPPRWHADAQRLADFLDAAPRRIRWAVEFRDASWLCDDVYEILAARDAALVIHDALEDHPRRWTADWTYLRFHGPRGHDSGYPHQYLVAWANRIRGWLEDGRDVHAYFNNDGHAYAVRDAGRLGRYVGDGA